MPNRNMTTSNSGDQNSYKGQKNPPKKQANGTVKDGEYNNGTRGNASVNTTRGGGGNATKGTYNATSSGFKTFGTEGQGSSQQGLLGDSAVCSQRQQYLTVTASVDQNATETTLIEFGAYTF